MSVQTTPRSAVNPDTWMTQVVEAAIARGASDMLLRTSPTGDVLTCDVSIDGFMRPFTIVRGTEAQVIIGRFKAESSLASGGSYRPEETIYEVSAESERRKVRVALFRTAEGGNAISMRLPPTGPLRTLDQLNFSDHNLSLLRDLLSSSSRMVLFAGPMGSGKTTTAHGALAEVADPTKTVWTVEDPVERRIPGLIQLEVDEENGADFDTLLKHLVRSNYDTLFLGEIRDRATAEAGVKQAKAGRQVITTIHANDNVTALLRLLDLSDESPLSVLDSVRGVVSQRLVARLNPHWDGRNPMEKYKGRVPVHEVLFVTEELVEAVMDNRSLGQIRHIAAKQTHSTFDNDAARLLAEGITDEDEVIRALGGNLMSGSRFRPSSPRVVEPAQTQPEPEVAPEPQQVHEQLAQTQAPQAWPEQVDAQHQPFEEPAAVQPAAQQHFAAQPPAQQAPEQSPAWPVTDTSQQQLAQPSPYQGLQQQSHAQVQEQQHFDAPPQSQPTPTYHVPSEAQLLYGNQAGDAQ